MCDNHSVICGNINEWKTNMWEKIFHHILKNLKYQWKKKLIQHILVFFFGYLWWIKWWYYGQQRNWYKSWWCIPMLMRLSEQNLFLYTPIKRPSVFTPVNISHLPTLWWWIIAGGVIRGHIFPSSLYKATTTLGNLTIQL